MASNSNTHLARQFGLVSALVFDEKIDNSKYFYRGYTTERNAYLELKSLAPVDRDITLGATTEFRVPLYFDKMGPLAICWNQDPVTATGDSYVRMCDWFPLALIEKVEFIFNSNVVHTHYPQKKYIRANKFVNIEERDAEAVKLAGNLSTTQRNTAAAAIQEIIYDLPMQTALAPDRYLEIRALADSPVLRITWRRLSNVVQTDGTDPVSVVRDCTLKINAIHLEAAERDVQILTTEKQDGIVRLIEESKVHPRHPSAIVPTTLWSGGGAAIATHKVELKNMRTDIRCIFFYIRKKANYDPANLAKNLWYEAGELTNGGVDWIKRFRLVTGSDEEITPWMTAKYNVFHQHGQHFFGPAGTRIYFLTWSSNPMDELNASGSYNFNSIPDPMLELDFNTFGSGGSGAEALEVEIIRSNYNMSQVVRGDWSVQFQHS
jgi:hypothetical protein